jgi:hypothetical protein
MHSTHGEYGDGQGTPSSSRTPRIVSPREAHDRAALDTSRQEVIAVGLDLFRLLVAEGGSVAELRQAAQAALIAVGHLRDAADWVLESPP